MGWSVSVGWVSVVWQAHCLPSCPPAGWPQEVEARVEALMDGTGQQQQQQQQPESAAALAASGGGGIGSANFSWVNDALQQLILARKCMAYR